MNAIARPALATDQQLEKVLQDFQEDYPDRMHSLQAQPSNAGLFVEPTREAFAASVVLDRPAQKSGLYLELLGDLAAAHFDLVQHAFEDCTVTIGGHEFALTGEDTRECIDPATWLQGYYAAIICRDADAIGRLRTFPTHAMRGATKKGVEFDYRFVDYMKGLYDPGADPGDLHLEALRAASPDLTGARAPFVDALKVPELSLYTEVFGGSEAGFNRRLEEALEQHHAFWMHEDRRHDPTGWVSLGLLAACVVAYGSKDYDIDVASDYIPRAFIEGTF